jgi:hypothetical protein
MTATILTGCNSNNETLTTENETVTTEESTTDVEALQFIVDAIESSNSIDKFNYKNGDTITQATTAVTEAAEAEKAELEADLAKAESESIDPFAGQEVSVDGDFTFAADVDPADKAQILKARDEAGLDASDCDTNGDGLIDKDEAADAAFLFDDEVIADANDFAESIKKSLEDELMQEIESSSSSSESTTGTGKVETWTADPGTTPQIDFSTPIDHSDLEKGVTVY